MRRTAILLIAASTISLGCQPARKVQNTLALGEIQNQAGFAENNGDDAKAIELWNEYVNRRPQQASAQYRLGKLLLSNGQPEAATDHLWVAHDLNPGNLEYLDLLAESMHQAGERENMFQLLQDTIEEGGLAAGHLRLAKHSLRAGLIDEAEESIRIAAAVDGNQSDRAHRALASLARQTGDSESEIQAWRTVLWFEPGDLEANTRLSELGEIPGPSLATPPRTSD
ncbi:MAG: tetratricopeptide repeat protein [Phycisphaerales bacterium]